MIPSFFVEFCASQPTQCHDVKGHAMNTYARTELCHQHDYIAKCSAYRDGCQALGVAEDLGGRSPSVKCACYEYWDYPLVYSILDRALEVHLQDMQSNGIP